MLRKASVTIPEAKSQLFSATKGYYGPHAPYSFGSYEGARCTYGRVVNISGSLGQPTCQGLAF